MLTLKTVRTARRVMLMAVPKMTVRSPRRGMLRMVAWKAKTAGIQTNGLMTVAMMIRKDAKTEVAAEVVEEIVVRTGVVSALVPGVWAGIEVVLRTQV